MKLTAVFIIIVVGVSLIAFVLVQYGLSEFIIKWPPFTTKDRYSEVLSS